MFAHRVMWSTVLLLLGLAVPASAQDDRRVGLVMGVPVQIGILWHVTERVALRPDVSFSWSSSDLGGASTDDVDYSYSSSTSLSRVTAGLTLLYYLSDDEGVRTYVAPRYQVSRASTSTDSVLTIPVIPGFPDVLPDSDRRHVTQVDHSAGVSFGASYAPVERLAVFGEAGLEFAASSSPRLGDLESTSRAVGTTAGVGVVLHF
jgi:hypothetical protein